MAENSVYFVNIMKASNSIYRSNVCPKVSVCPNCKTRNHSPYYICPLLQSISSGWVLDPNFYHSDDPYLSHHNKTGYGVNNASRDLQVYPVISNNRAFTCKILGSKDLMSLISAVPVVLIIGI